MKQFTQQGAAVQALKLGCESFPVETRLESTRKVIIDAFAELLPLIERPQIANILTVLDEEESVNLMRYLFKIMEISDKKACDCALAFHGALVAKYGNGIVSRALQCSITKKLA
eukprot:UN04709